MLQTVGYFHTVWVKYREWVGGIWLDSLKQRHVCFTSKFACNATLVTQCELLLAVSVVTRAYVQRT